ncbi:MAG TPA: DUF5672 family protein [Burkholderiales bacterium]|nr:DUF5672 family protein [Burkholderiales bacterium]
MRKSAHASDRIIVSALVVVPLYRESLDPAETIALTQCCRLLSRHAVAFVAPDGLDVARAKAIAEREGAAACVERFAAPYFRSSGTYNALLLSENFYRRFEAHEYILIHQLDAFAFADELDRFCALGYDYIGAPWLHDPSRGRIVGNGGFSLRKVESALRVLQLPQSRVPQRLALAWRRHGLLRKRSSDWLGRTGRLDRIMQSDDFLPLALTHLMHVNEDGFWGQNCDKLPFFTTAPYREALAFSFETDPALAYERNGRALPFGCHGFPYIAPEFWRPHIEACGYAWKQAA